MRIYIHTLFYLILFISCNSASKYNNYNKAEEKGKDLRENKSISIDTLCGTWVQANVISNKLQNKSEDSLFSLLSSFTINKDNLKKLVIEITYYEQRDRLIYDSYAFDIKEDYVFLIDKKTNQKLLRYNIGNETIDEFIILKDVFASSQGSNNPKEFKKISNKVIQGNIEQYVLCKRLKLDNIIINYDNKVYDCQINLLDNKQILNINGLNNYNAIQITDYKVKENKLLISVSLLNKDKRFVSFILEQVNDNNYNLISK